MGSVGGANSTKHGVDHAQSCEGFPRLARPQVSRNVIRKPETSSWMQSHHHLRSRSRHLGYHPSVRKNTLSIFRARNLASWPADRAVRRTWHHIKAPTSSRCIRSSSDGEPLPSLRCGQDPSPFLSTHPPTPSRPPRLRFPLFSCSSEKTNPHRRAFRPTITGAKCPCLDPAVPRIRVLPQPWSRRSLKGVRLLASSVEP